MVGNSEVYNRLNGRIYGGRLSPMRKIFSLNKLTVAVVIKFCQTKLQDFLLLWNTINNPYTLCFPLGYV